MKVFPDEVIIGRQKCATLQNMGSAVKSEKSCRLAPHRPAFDDDAAVEHFCNLWTDDSIIKPHYDDNNVKEATLRKSLPLSHE